MKLKLSLAVMLCLCGIAFSQTDSVDVTFEYHSEGAPSLVYLPGEFNGWTNNARSAMDYQPDSDTWTKTVRLRVGGPSPLPDPPRSIPGAYQYKINEDGTLWLSDPANPRRNSKDNNNTYLFVQNPTVFMLLPNVFSEMILVKQPEFSSRIFPSVSSTVDAASIRLYVDGSEFDPPDTCYHPETRRFACAWPSDLEDGSHTVVLTAQSSFGTTGSDTARFEVSASLVRFLTRPNPGAILRTQDIVGETADKISSVTLNCNGAVIQVPVTAGRFTYSATLDTGLNRFQASAIGPFGQEFSPFLDITFAPDLTIRPQIAISVNEGIVTVTASPGNPDSASVTFNWIGDDPANPSPLQFSGSGASVQFPSPAVPGDYVVRLEASDAHGHSGSAGAMFRVESSGVSLPGVNGHPAWVDSAVVYEIYVPSWSPEGTLDGVTANLDRIQELGANVIWLMPIYENGETINEMNAGYNVTDYDHVHPQLGGDEAFDIFLDEAHQRGMKVILDNTPNHVGEAHPWVQDLAKYQDYSIYRPMIEKRLLGDSRGMGQSVVLSDGYSLYARYSNWSLANLNYGNLETKQSMTAMLERWLVDRNVDGFRLDVYWGPQNRYGAAAWWRPFREEVKRLKPDVFLLGETDGTGNGSQGNYTDGGGALDAAYDWSWFRSIRDVFSSGVLGSLDLSTRNYSPELDVNYYTGENSRYFRFLENHDETRIAFQSGLAKSKAGATMLLTIPGIPMIYAGQEVGETSRRGLINWSRTGSQETRDFYARLIRIRKRFPAFLTSLYDRIGSDKGQVFAFIRPDTVNHQPGLVAINFSGKEVSAILSVLPEDLGLDPNAAERTWYFSDVLNDTVYTVSTAHVDSIPITLGAWQSAVLIPGDSPIYLDTGVKERITQPGSCGIELAPNYPNPFNGETVIRYRLTGASHVKLSVFNLLGVETAILVNGRQDTGSYSAAWDGKDRSGRAVSSGVYLIRLKAGGGIRTQKMAVVR